jgi:pimeloyl-ACP methyl ester carboxylesterase
VSNEWNTTERTCAGVRSRKQELTQLESDPNYPAKVFASTLVIWGMSDVALKPGLIEGLEEHVPDLEIVRIPEGTHWVVQEFPERVNGAIREYLGR